MKFNKYMRCGVSKVVLIATVFFFSILFLYQNYKESFIFRINSVISELATETGLVFEKTENVPFLVFSSEGEVFSAQSDITFSVKKTFQTINEAIEDPDLETVSSKVDLFFLQSGYVANFDNTSRNLLDLKFGFFSRAFENIDEGFLCIESIGEGYQSWILNCVDHDTFLVHVNEQEIFRGVLNASKNAALFPKQLGNYARVGVTINRDGGYYAILKKNNDIWEVIYQGQDDPSCKLMTENAVPPALYYSKCLSL